MDKMKGELLSSWLMVRLVKAAGLAYLTIALAQALWYRGYFLASGFCVFGCYAWRYAMRASDVSMDESLIYVKSGGQVIELRPGDIRDVRTPAWDRHVVVIHLNRETVLGDEVRFFPRVDWFSDRENEIRAFAGLPIPRP